MLKLPLLAESGVDVSQPPSGGCVLKLQTAHAVGQRLLPAAFRRLCVETGISIMPHPPYLPSRLQAAVC